MKLSPDEIQLNGTWQLVGRKLVADPVAHRIAILTGSYLVRVCADPSGWDSLYRDPADGRFWELTYPESDVQGGGPPRLECLSIDQVREKYGPAEV